ncbi:MAG: hypothetical protein IJ193_05625 [Bacilli bacterium]|nr:hypothetical protein [Bacilli bacterium]
MSISKKEQLKKYKEVLKEYGVGVTDLRYDELELLEAADHYFKMNHTGFGNLDAFDMFDQSIDRVKKCILFSKGLNDSTAQDIYLKYPMMNDYLTDFISKVEGQGGSRMKATSLIYHWASHNPFLYSKPVDFDNTRYDHPSVGTSKDWFSFTDAIYHLAAGSLKEYDEEREKVLSLYPDDGSNAKIFKHHDMAVKLVGKVIQEAEHCENYMDKSKYLFQEFEHALDYMDILDMDTELENSPNKGDFYLWFDLVNSANELCTSGVTTNFEKSKQNVLKTYHNK